jgi:preprotein translocase subunit SecY
MSKSQKTSIFSRLLKKNRAVQKLTLTLFIVFLYRFCNTIPLGGIDQEALKQAFSQVSMNNSIIQILNMYSGGGGGTTLLSPFSLGIVPFINASILIDLLTAIVPFLEKLQSEEGEFGRRKLLFYKKILTLVFAIGQSFLLLFYLKPYIYSTSFLDFSILITQLTCGALILVWFSSLIDNKGIGNGTSIIIFINIIGTLLNKNIFLSEKLNISFLLQIVILIFLMLLICISQTSRIIVNVVSARQLAFLENLEETDLQDKIPKKLKGKKESGLSIRFNQAGIFPIIIASNIIPFLSYFFQSLFPVFFASFLSNLFYYFLIIGFNYFYTIIFWDPEKISEQLRKASVSILNVTPGKDTVSYLENVVRSSSLVGGIFLCLILFSFDVVKQLINGSLLNQINISSLIILVGVAYEIQKTARALFKNELQNTSFKTN